MITKELFEGPVGDYCIARNTIKCLLSLRPNPSPKYLWFNAITIMNMFKVIMLFHKMAYYR